MKKVLIVEDSSTIRHILSNIIRSLEMDVSEAVHGADALEKVGEVAPDLILLDWNMPVMDGLEFLKALRSKDIPQPLVIFCTTENEIDKIQVALENGADEYIMKPFTKDILSDKLQQVGLL